MAAFTSLALVSAGLLAGTAASKLANRNRNQQQPPLAPGPASPASLTPPAPPIVNPSDANAAGIAAGKRQRKRAAGGSLLTGGLGEVSSTMPVKPRTQPRTLLGS